MVKGNVEEALLDADYQPGEGLGVRVEVKKQLWLAGPLIAGALLQNVVQMISVMYVGHLGELPLAGASMANSFASVTGFNVLLGMASALDTQCGQAYGARQYNLLGIYKQRAMLFLTMRRRATWSSASWLLVYALGMGSKGAALSNAISYWLNVAVLAVYVRVSSACKETWTGFSTEAFHDALSFFRLAIPSALMVCLEMWSFELVVLLSGLLPNPKLETSVLSISLNTSAFVWMIPFGLNSAIR
ncbi:Protein DETOXIFICATION 14 [Dichanthelium oligosanthes]|uniref:Protein DETOXIFICATION 14 n=1 Tax=Dichanthelium oligosanthes TaxID=888268 RepID=A0A1E5VJ28_9POAL|nr:Protein DETOXIFICATION 14 [Dichanthelium oligosanthes]